MRKNSKSPKKIKYEFKKIRFEPINKIMNYNIAEIIYKFKKWKKFNRVNELKIQKNVKNIKYLAH